MSISISAGSGGLIQLGLSVSGIALFVENGKKFGNFLRVNYNDNDLFTTIGETPEAILKRRGLVSATGMEKKWPTVRFIHRGGRVTGEFRAETKNEENGRNKKGKKMEKSQTADTFTWVMAAIVSALDDCLTSSGIQELLIQVFVTVLAGDEATKEALRVHLRVNIESWRSFGIARDLTHIISHEMRKSLSKHLPISSSKIAVREMNDAETEDMMRFLIWLLGGNVQKLSAMSAITFAVAEALRSAKFDVCTDGEPRHEGQACITYLADSWKSGECHPQGLPTAMGLNSRALQIAWPRDNPQTMIDTLPVDRQIINRMEKLWEYGSKAAEGLSLVGKADLPFEERKEVFYNIEVPIHAHIRKKFSTYIGMLADQGFPVDTQSVYESLEKLAQGQPPEKLIWLHSHVSHDYLLRNESTHLVPEKANMDIFLNYQALIFGFYYRLFQQLLSFELVEAEAFFHGIWGTGSMTFLAMCTQFSNCLRSTSSVTRAHVLYMLAAMYNGRRKVFHANSSMPRLVGVLGSISVLALPLIRTTDLPEEICKFAIVDLPIVDLVPDTNDGELMVGAGGGIKIEPAFDEDKAEISIQPGSSTMEWTVHPNMSMIFGSEQNGGVVMAARCGGRLVGWFNPLAADVIFLSDAYVREGEYELDSLSGFAVKDEHWQKGCVRRPVGGSKGRQFGIVHSRGSPELRYAAAGFFAELGEEVAIAKSVDQFGVAYGRLEAQEQGVAIA